MNRRNLIQLSFYSGLASLLGCFDQKERFGANENFDHYIMFNLFGAPARWNFDNPLNDEVNQGPMVFNRLENSPLDESAPMGSYKHIKKRNYSLPPFWNLKGSKGNFSDLLDNTLTLRGFHMVNDGHLPANRKILGIENNIFSENYRANNLVATLLTGGISPVKELYENTNYNALVYPEDEHFAHYLKESLKLLKSISPDKLDDIVSANLRTVGIKKEKLLKLNQTLNYQEVFLSEYPVLYKKYLSLINSSKKILLKNKNIMGEQKDFIKAGKTYSNRVLERHSSRNHFFLDNFYDSFESSDMSYWASQFALSELLVVNGFSRHIILSPKASGNYWESHQVKSAIEKSKFNLKNKEKHLIDKETIKAITSYLKFDGHKTGTILTHFSSYSFWFCFSDCLLELKDSLKQAKKFKSTLIHLNSEFTRVPAFSEDGSQHNINNHVSSFISGKIPHYSLHGNIRYTLGKDPFKGKSVTDVSGGINKELGRKITYHDHNATLSQLLFKKNMSLAGRPLADIRNGQVKSLLSKSQEEVFG